MAGSKIFISGYYGFDNAGDEAILSVMLDELRVLVPGAQITVLSGNPAETAAAHGVQTVVWSDPLAIAEGVRQADLVLVGGGGLFHDYTGFIPDGLLTEGNWGLGFHVTAALLAALYGRPLMLYAVGVGPLFSEHGRKFTRAACEAASVVTVRDSGSKEILESIGVDPEKVIVTADPAFALTPAPAGRAREIAAAEGFPAARPLVGVVVRHWAFGVHPVFWEKEVAGALDLFLEDSDAGVVLIPFQQIPGVQENDRAVAARVHSQMKHQARAVVASGAYRPAELAAVVGLCDLVVGMRLHASIFSILSKVPFVALDYDPKVRFIIREAGLESSALDIGGVEAPVLYERMKQALAGRAEYLRQVEPALAVLREQALRNGNIAVHTMTAGAPPALTPDVVSLLRMATLAQLRAGDDVRRRLGAESQARQAVEDARAALERAAVESQEQYQRERAEWGGRAEALELEVARLGDRAASLERRAKELETARTEAEARFASERAVLEAMKEGLRLQVEQLEVTRAEAARQAAAWERHLRELNQTVTADLECARQEAAEERQRREAALAEGVRRAAEAEENCRRLAAALTEHARKAREAEEDRRRLEAALAGQTKLAAEFEARTRALEEQHQAVLKLRAQERQRLRKLQAWWDTSLAGYRGQRAWTVMLVFRKGYTLLVRRGVTGWLQFLAWAPGLLIGRTGDLTEYELGFPRIPEDLLRDD